jgi:hypothetical protein
MMDGRVRYVTPLVGGSLKPQCGLECIKLGAVIDLNTV